MANEVKKFVVGREKFPAWFNDEASKGRVKVNYNDENEIISITVFAPTKTLFAKPGDVIMSLKSGLTVLPEDKAIKYGVKNERK